MFWQMDFSSHGVWWTFYKKIDHILYKKYSRVRLNLLFYVLLNYSIETEENLIILYIILTRKI